MVDHLKQQGHRLIKYFTISSPFPKSINLIFVSFNQATVNARQETEYVLYKYTKTKIVQMEAVIVLCVLLPF